MRKLVYNPACVSSTMFCPSCGAENSTDQRYCRRCGMNLEPAAESLREQYPAGNRQDLDLRERRIEKFGRVAFMGFVVVIALAVIALIIAIMDKMVLSGDKPLFGIAVMAFLISAVLLLAYVFFREDLKEKRRKAGYDFRHEPEELTSPVVTGKLIEEGHFEPVPTVTENTTDLLPRKGQER